MIGWMIPFARIERDSSSIRSSSICVRGWNLLGRRRSVSTSSARSADAAGAGAVSGMSALRPRPSAGRFSTMVLILCWDERGALPRQELAREREVRLRAARLHVVENRGHAVARRFAKPDVARDDGVEDAVLEELPDVARDLLPQVRPLVVHRHEDAGDV